MELDKDLQARQEARLLAQKAQAAQAILADFSQAQLDTIVEAVAATFYQNALELAELAVRETGFSRCPRGERPLVELYSAMWKIRS